MKQKYFFALLIYLLLLALIAIQPFVIPCPEMFCDAEQPFLLRLSFNLLAMLTEPLLAV